jgi:predicted dehydrogenase
MGTPVLRWGILGAANIARKNWKAIWNSGNGRITAVASRDHQRAQRFVEECQAQVGFDSPPRAVGSYEELLAAKDVDAVYIPLPTGVRALWVKRAAQAGKHVVCEKPCATSSAELAEMLEVCRQNQVQFMDGVMFMHSRRLERMREALDDGSTVGRIRRVTSAFTFRASEEFFTSNIRAHGELEPYGCLGDLGWYCIRFALWTTNWKLPSHVTGRTLSDFQQHAGEFPVPTEFSGELFFEDGITSSFYCSFLSETEQWAMVSGERGFLQMADFVLPFSGTQISFVTGKPEFLIRGCDFEMQPGTRRWDVTEDSHGTPTAQETLLFQHFANEVLSGKHNPLWPDIALKTQQVMDACRESARADGGPVKLTSEGPT